MLRGLTLGWLLVVLAVGACSPTRNPSIHLTVEEAGLVAKGELFRIYGGRADPVMIGVQAEEDRIESRPVWRLDTEVQIVTDRGIEHHRWIFWVGLGPEGSPEVVRRSQVD